MYQLRIEKHEKELKEKYRSLYQDKTCFDQLLRMILEIVCMDGAVSVSMV